MIVINAKIRQKALKFSGFALVFGLIKLNSFTAALFLSNLVVSTADYGLFEYALSLGLIIAIPLDLGMQVAYPFFNLKIKKRGFRPIFYFHALIISSSIIAFLFFQELFFSILADKWNFGLLIGGIIFSQSLLSAILKSHGRIYSAVFFDGGLFIGLNLYNLYLYISGELFNFQSLTTILYVYITILLCIQIYSFFKTTSDFKAVYYVIAIKFGRPILVSAFLIIWLTGGARIFIEYFLGLESVGVYAFYLRLAGVMMMLNQIINIAFYKKIYQARATELDIWFPCFIVSIFLIGILTYAIIPFFLRNHFQLFDQTWAEHHNLFIILNFYMIFWIGMALYENIIYREELAKDMNKYFLKLNIFMIGLFLGFNYFNLLDLFSLTIINGLMLFLATEIQNFLLLKKGIVLIKTKLVNRILVGLLSFYTLVNIVL